MARLPWSLALLVGASCGNMGCSCDPAEARLLVDLRTDYVGGAEVDFARTAVFVGDETLADRRLESGLPEGDLTHGVRIAELQGLAPGRYRLEVELSGAVPTPSRTVVIDDVSGSHGVTVVISRACEGRACPPDGAPELSACLGGVCVDPGCQPEMPLTCPPPECATDVDCRSSIECAEPVCLGGACSGRPVAERCPIGEYCDPSVGCRPRAGIVDASMPDSSLPDSSLPDSSPPDSAPADAMPDAAATSACGAPATDCDIAPFLFCDSFESGDVKDDWLWSCIASDPGCSDDIDELMPPEGWVRNITTEVCGGGQAIEAHVIGSPRSAYVGMQFPDPRPRPRIDLPDEYFFRIFFRVPSDSDSDGKRFFIGWISEVGRPGNYIDRIEIGVGDDPGDMALWVPAGRTDFPAGISRDAWTCLEARLTPSEIDIWIDEVLVHTHRGAIWPMMSGLIWGAISLGMLGGRPMPTTVQMDELIVDDERVGCAAL